MPVDALPHDRPFLVRDALPVVGRARLRRCDLAIPARGLRVVADGAERSPVELFAPLLAPDQHFSHLTAARFWRLPVPDRADLHVSTVGDGPIMRRAGVTGHRVDPGRARVRQIGDVRVSPPLQAWTECSTLLSHEQLVIAGDHLVGSGSGYSVDEIAAAVRGHSGRRGATALRAALADVRVGAESPRETRLRLLLVQEGFRMPLLNCSIHDRLGGFIARPDLIYGRERVCVEYDGDHHRTDRRTYRDDKRRREALADAGWRVLYLSDDDLTAAHWAAFVVRLRRARRSRARSQFDRASG